MLKRVKHVRRCAEMTRSHGGACRAIGDSVEFNQSEGRNEARCVTNAVKVARRFLVEASITWAVIRP